MEPFFFIVAPELLIPGRFPPGTEEPPDVSMFEVKSAPLEFV